MFTFSLYTSEMSLVSSQMSRATSSVTLLDGWTSSYEQELSSFESVALFAEVRTNYQFITKRRKITYNNSR